MKNVYDIRKEKNLYFILSDEYILNEYLKNTNFSIAVIANLYYADDAEWYLHQLAKISSYVEVYVISSNQTILDMIDDKNIHTLKKENRGRDISALLVASKDIVREYEYICFLHDKKEKSKKTVNDIKLWVDNMWFNLIKSKDYINNVIAVFNKNPKIGLLVPPEPIGRHWHVWGKELWQIDYENTRNLCHELQLNCDINADAPPITLGTAFWCRTKALIKLFEQNWKYEDFQNEPLPNGGTISHAIERILAYVAQDAGYDVGTVVTEEYASKQLLMQQEYIPKAFGILKQFFSINSFEDLDQIERFQSFCKKYKKIYLYGAGKIGSKCALMLKAFELEPECVIVTKRNVNMTMGGIPILEFDEIESFEDIGIIVSVDIGLQSSIIKILKEKGVQNYICYGE